MVELRKAGRTIRLLIRNTSQGGQEYPRIADLSETANDRPQGPEPYPSVGVRGDDGANRIVEFIGTVWPRNHTEETRKEQENLNSDSVSVPCPSVADLDFIEQSLGMTIRRYLATGFYKHHLSMYKRRPIYWLFSSGKQRAFQCLVYLHRYHEGTLARMCTEYVIPLQGQIAARIEQLEGDKAKATSTSHRRKLQKEQDDLKKQQAELATFEEKLKELIHQMAPGEEIVITENQQPVAKLVSEQPQP